MILVNFEISMKLVILVSIANLLLLVTMLLLVNLLILAVQTFIQDRAKECIYSIDTSIDTMSIGFNDNRIQCSMCEFKIFNLCEIKIS